MVLPRFLAQHAGLQAALSIQRFWPRLIAVCLRAMVVAAEAIDRFTSGKAINLYQTVALH